MRELPKACIACLSTNIKLHSLNNENLRGQFNLVSGLQNKIMYYHFAEHMICFECLAYVRRCCTFRAKCQRAVYFLQQLLDKNQEINKFHLKNANRNDLKIAPALSYLNLKRTNYQKVQFKWTKQNRIGFINKDIIPVTHYSTFENNEDQCFEVPLINNELNDDITVKTEAQEPESYEGHILNNFNTEDNENVEHFFDDNEDVQIETDIDNINEECNEKGKTVGTKIKEEYADLYPISRKEAKAVFEVWKRFQKGSFNCNICKYSFTNEEKLNVHTRMHNTHISGNFQCDICVYYYKTDFLLQTHITEKHMYKYVCRKCPEVNFNRASAKNHYVMNHLRQCLDADWFSLRPNWLRKKSMQRIKVQKAAPKQLPKDFPLYTPISQDEQYSLVLERRKTANYLESKFKCELCFKGFREEKTYNNHMQKHDPDVSGKMQCDMCKVYFKDGRKMYKHMNTTHLFKYSCQMCEFVCYNKSQAHIHYRWHKNVVYDCPHCDKVFYKISTRLTHIRMKHPSMYICNLCGHSFVSEAGLGCHKQLVHTKEERILSENVTVDQTDQYYCDECDIQFINENAFATHLGSSNKHATTNISCKPIRRSARDDGRKTRGRPRKSCSEIINNGITTSSNCEVCGKFLANDVQARRHYESEHPGTEFLKRYMCDVCGHTTRQYANLMVHMRTHTREKPYGCPHCDRRFSMPSNRDRHIVVHTGEKKYQCQHCNRRFTQSSAVKLHIQTVHLKIPYAPWDKKNLASPSPPSPPTQQQNTTDNKKPYTTRSGRTVTFKLPFGS
ncbi:hypothetical protein K1T71_013591 [Dendrolimus kikuchii]|uniref:Uncharacterized protein n=1 Tax=Dendrolimus kikuchii TaxID=765133 RepID=A0ACC1CGX9_9NEOP|nr:hypothetical protein K1T71_013591 [Dendrolimus kikuchii]